MNHLNLVVEEGNLTRDPELNWTKRDRPICSFSIAVDKFFRMGEETKKETYFFDVETWDDLAEICKRIGHKGRGCRVTGELKQERWNAPDGALRSKIIIVANKVEFRPEKRNETK
jgi:single-strand DNA-binding protein